MQTGERIKARRKELGISADALAGAIGVDRSTIFRYENGEIENISLKNVEPIAKALHCSPAYLLGWEDSNDEEKPASDEEDRLNLEIMNLFLSLPEEKQKEALSYLRYLAGSSETK